MASEPASGRAVFEREVLVHLPAAYNLAYLLLRKRADAEDAVQDATVRAYRSFRQMRGVAAKPWLLAIVRNVCYRRLQQNKRAANVISFDEALVAGVGFDESTFMQSAARSPEDEAVLASEQSVLRRAISQLPPVFREVIILRELEELSYSDIAGVTGAPAGTVMSRLARARESLRETMMRLMKEDDGHAV